MMPTFLALTLFPLLLLSELVYASSPAHDVGHRRRHAVNTLTPSSEHNLQKRYDGARLTWYDVTTGQTACGGWYNNNDWIVALSQNQYNNGQYCNAWITIYNNGKSARARIVDDCPGCPDYGLDMSEGLFSYFDSLSAGELWGSWWFD